MTSFLVVLKKDNINLQFRIEANSIEEAYPIADKKRESIFSGDPTVQMTVVEGIQANQMNQIPRSNLGMM